MPCVLDPTSWPGARRPHPDRDERVRRALAARVATDQAFRVTSTAGQRMLKLSEWANRGLGLRRWSGCFLAMLDRAVVAFGEAAGAHLRLQNRELELFDLCDGEDDKRLDGWAQ